MFYYIDWCRRSLDAAAGDLAGQVAEEAEGRSPLMAGRMKERKKDVASWYTCPPFLLESFFICGVVSRPWI